MTTYFFACISAVVGYEGRGLLPRPASAGGCASTRKAASTHEMPAHHKLEQFLDEYLAAAGIRDGRQHPPLPLDDRQDRAVDGKRLWTGSTPNSMIRRRTAEAGFKIKLGCHVFRATGITAYLEAGGTLEKAQAMAAHESPRTTKL